MQDNTKNYILKKPKILLDSKKTKLITIRKNFLLCGRNSVRSRVQWKISRLEKEVW